MGWKDVDERLIRRRILDLDLDLDPSEHLRKVEEPLSIAVDSTGVKVNQAGGWVERNHGKRRRYVKVHFAMNVETGEVVAMEVTTDDARDATALASLVEQPEEHGRVVRLYGDGDGATTVRQSMTAFESRGGGAGAVIKPRRSSRADTPSPARRRLVTADLHLAQYMEEYC